MSEARKLKYIQLLKQKTTDLLRPGPADTDQKEEAFKRSSVRDEIVKSSISYFHPMLGGPKGKHEWYPHPLHHKALPDVFWLLAGWGIK